MNDFLIFDMFSQFTKSSRLEDAEKLKI